MEAQIADLTGKTPLFARTGELRHFLNERVKSMNNGLFFSDRALCDRTLCISFKLTLSGWMFRRYDWMAGSCIHLRGLVRTSA